MNVYSTFSEAVDRFIEVAYWLTDNEAPAVTALAQSAASLDRKISATMMGEFTKNFRYLRGLKPEDGKVIDDLDALLETL